MIESPNLDHIRQRLQLPALIACCLLMLSALVVISLNIWVSFIKQVCQ